MRHSHFAHRPSERYHVRLATVADKGNPNAGSPGQGQRAFRYRPQESFDLKGKRLDQRLQGFKRSCEKAGILTEARRREFYEKPTSMRKRKAAAAVKRYQKKLAREAMRRQQGHQQRRH